FEELSESLDPDLVLKWHGKASKADEDCGEALDIYLLKMEKAPTLAEIRLLLTESQTNSSTGRKGSVAW
ncbi:hypothetical protein PAXRUDRAFT_169613, partial [Paxillus rubicundulus Ve08.2h10]